MAERRGSPQRREKEVGAGRRTVWRIAPTLVETAILVTAAVYVVSGSFWTLVLWEALGVVYMVGGLLTMWAVLPAIGTADRVVAWRRWNWVLPLASSIVGVYSAVVALTVRNTLNRDVDDLVFAIAASTAVVISWILLQVGFAQIYRVLDARRGQRSIQFPGETSGGPVEYLYFAFTIGTSFATSDANVRTVAARRVVMVQSIVCFFYNALVVAIAFQVLQQVVTA